MIEEKLECLFEEIKDYFKSLKINEINEKAPVDYVTNIDYSIDRYISEKLPKILPEANIFSEEQRSIKQDGIFWIIDPVDGTHNLLANIPFYSVSIALCDSCGPIASGILDLNNNEIYTATKSQGARKKW